MSLFGKIKSVVLLPKRLQSALQREELISREILRTLDFQYRDMLDIQSGKKTIRHNDTIALETAFPVAYDSPDHINPLGTIQDNTRNFAFYNKCRKLFGLNMSFLDLGCSGGGLVFDFALNGHLAIGLEGSDRSQKMGRANWRTIPNNLFTCDITKPFTLRDTKANTTKKFEVISCWEVLEHIPEADLSQLLDNVTTHLADGGIFIGSISKIMDDPLHVTIYENNWWVKKFAELGLSMVVGYGDSFEFSEFCRGVKGGLFDSHDYRADPQKGFHFIARKQG